MAKGILLGLLTQAISVVGYMVIVNITSIKTEVFRTGLMICFAAVVALGACIYSVVTGKQQLSAIQPREYMYVAIGSILVMFVAQLIYFYAVQLSNMTMVAYTMLAFPVMSLVFEIILGRVKLSTLGIRDLAGFLLLAAGYAVIVSKPQPQ